MELMDVSKLIPHPRNAEFFDDMAEEPWTAFLESIKTSGVIEPIIATQDLVIVSGHQRIRACKELGINEVLVDVRVFDSEDEILKQLIETNIRQRGVGNTNAVKLGRCIVELERIYGISHGGNRGNQHTVASGQNVALAKSQEALAEELGITKRNLQRYKSLTTLIPELQDAVQTGKITATTAMGLVKQLSHEDQEQLADMIVDKEKLTNREVEFYKRRVQELNLENIKLNKENTDLKEREPEVIEKEVEVEPKDYKQKTKDLELYKKDNRRITKENEELAKKNSELERRIKEQELKTPEQEEIIKAKEEMDYFSIATHNYIKNYGGYVWTFNKWADVPIETRKNFEKAIQLLAAFSQQMTNNLGGLEA